MEVRLCACGCGEPTSKYFDKNGVWKTYRKYAVGHIPKKVVTPLILKSLAKGRATCWSNPKYRLKMSKVSSKAMQATNARRLAGEFPEWSTNMRNATSKRMLEFWATKGSLRNLWKKAGQFRSKIERRFAKHLTSLGIEWLYEPVGFPVLVDGKKRTYHPDFYLPKSDVWIELKPYWYSDLNKKKIMLFAEQYPQLNFSIVDGKFNTIFGKPWGT